MRQYQSIGRSHLQRARGFIPTPFLLLIVVVLFGTYVTKLILTNPVMILHLIPIAAAIIYVTLCLTKLYLALQIFLIWILFHPFIKSVIFHDSSTLVAASKDVMLVLLFTGWLFRLAARRERRIFIAPIDGPVLLFFGITVIALLRSPNFASGLMDFRTIAGYMSIYLITAHAISNRTQLNRSIALVGIGGGIVAVYAIIEQAIGIKGVQALGYVWIGEYAVTRSGYPYHDIGGHLFSSSTVGAPHVLAVYMMMIIVLMVTRLSSSARKLRWQTAVVSLSLISLFFTYNRTGFVAFFVSLVLFASFLKKRGTVVVLVLSLILLLLLPLGFVSTRLQDLANPFSAESPYSLHGRRVGWASNLRMAMQNPFGVGLGQWGIIGWSRWVEGVAVSIGGTDSHYVKMLLETGFVGLFVFLWILHLIVKIGVQSFRRLSDRHLRTLAAALTSAIVGVILANLTNNYFELSPTAPYFWFFVGMLCCLKNRRVTAYGEASQTDQV